VILDLMLPGMQGEAVLEALRDAGDVPVLITSAKRSDAERIAGLRLGADDYLGKPFNPHELTARVAAILRRTRPAAAEDDAILSLADGRLVLDPGSRRYTLADGSTGRLTPGEAGLLLALARRPGAVVSREALLESVARRPDEVFERVVDVHVANLRKKLGDDAGTPWLIETVPSAGYRLVATRDAS
jgi:DNA-binding response OmpR family regulator